MEEPMYGNYGADDHDWVSPSLFKLFKLNPRYHRLQACFLSCHIVTRDGESCPA